MGTYKKNGDKRSGDGLALTEWNDLSNAVAGNSGLTLALHAADKIGIGTSNPESKLSVQGNVSIGGSGQDGKFHLMVSGHAGIGTTTQPLAPLSISSPTGKESGPDGSLHITNNCILFGGNNNGREANSAQISAGKHSANSLNIVGMSSGASHLDRKVEIWAEGGLKVNGNVTAAQFIGDGSQLTNLNVGATGLSLATQKGSMVAVGHTGPQATLDVARGTGPWGTAVFRGTERLSHFSYHESEDTYIRGGKSNANVLINDNGGKVGIGTSTPSHILHVKAPGEVGLFESTVSNAYLRLSTSEGFEKRVEFCNRPGGRAAIWVSGVGDAINALPNGNVGIGTENPQQKLEVNGRLRLTGNNNTCDIWVESDRLVFKLAKSFHGNTRSVYWDGDTNLDTYTPSDSRLKTSILNEDNILERLMKLDVKNYNWKADPDNATKEIGFMAQDVKPLFPALVREVEDPETKTRTMTLKYAGFGVLAFGAIKQHKLDYDNRITAMEKEIAMLKKSLKAQLSAE